MTQVRRRRKHQSTSVLPVVAQWLGQELEATAERFPWAKRAKKSSNRWKLLVCVVLLCLIRFVYRPTISTPPRKPPLAHHGIALNTSTLISWTDLREALCPAGRYPRVDLGETLFDIAADHLRNESSHDDMTTTFLRTAGPPSVTKFFHGAYGEGQGDGIAYLPLYELGITSDGPKFLFYIRIWKAGNDQIRNWLGSTLRVYKEWNGWFSLPPTKHARLHHRQEQSACIVTAIRDPISHFLSGYNEIESRYMGRISPRGFSQMDKHRLEQRLKYVHYPAGSKQRFQQFVGDWLLSADCRQVMMDHWMYEHVFPTSRVLSELAELGLSLTAYLPSLDQLSTRWPTFLKQHCPGFDGAFSAGADSDRNKANASLLQNPHVLLSEQRMATSGQHDSSSDPYQTYQAALQVWEDQESTAKALCVLHVLDYACWINLPKGVPPLCQEVYGSTSFQLALLAYTSS